jgi:hypothetical protein
MHSYKKDFLATHDENLPFEKLQKNPAKSLGFYF